MDVRGMKVIALQDEDGAVWFAEDGEQDIFRCAIGDRAMHIDELAPPECNKRKCFHGKVAGPHCAFVRCDNSRDACPDHKRGYEEWNK